MKNIWHEDEKSLDLRKQDNKITEGTVYEKKNNRVVAGT